MRPSKSTSRVQLEPIDVGSHAEPQIGRLADPLAVGVHLPALGGQRTNGRTQGAGGDLDVATRASRIEQPAKTLLDELRPALLLALFVSHDAAAKRPLDDGPLRTGGPHLRSEVIERHVSLQPIAVQAARRAGPAASDAEPGRR